MLREFESKAMAEYSAQDILKNLSVQQKDVLMGCEYNPINIRNFQINSGENKNFVINSKSCKKIKNVLGSIYEGKKCFTYFSDLVKNEEMGPDDELDITGENCREPDFCEKRRRWSREFEGLLNETRGKMVFDLNPSIELLVKSIENDIWHAYVVEPILITGKCKL